MIIEVKNLNKTYHTGTISFQALHDINLSIDEGEFTAISGPSGSGKTTLLNMIGAIDSPDSGNIFFKGDDIAKADSDSLARFRRENCGFIFQTYNLIPTLTVFENAALPLRILKTIRKWSTTFSGSSKNGGTYTLILCSWLIVLIATGSSPTVTSKAHVRTAPMTGQEETNAITVAARWTLKTY